jgi:hypothetical protein
MRQAALGLLIVAIAAAIVGVDFAQRNVPIHFSAPTS